MDDKKTKGKDEEKSEGDGKSEENPRPDEQLEDDRESAEDAERENLDSVKEDKDKNFEHKYKRALADYQNLLKRTAEEKAECARYANEDLLREFLQVYNHLKLALKHVPEPGKNGNGVEEGLQYVLRQFKGILENNGVAEIETAGKKYDPHTMEAMDKKETEEESLDGMVAEEIKPGYTLYGRVVEPARVIVYELKHEA